jgi:16S rRNA (cytosine967-C5)-methyltransferase
MRLGGRIAAAVEVLDDMAKRHRPAADTLKDWGLSHRFAGSGDRAAIGNLVYDVLRRKLSLGWRIGSDDNNTLVFAALLESWDETAATIRSKLEGDRFAPDFPDMEKFNKTSLADAPVHVQANIPEWSARLLENQFGAKLIEEGRALSERPPVDLRVNNLLSNRERVLAQLPDSIGAIPSAFSPDGIRIPSGGADYRQPNVQAEPAFQKGEFEIQDEGSQLAALIAGARPGEIVLDYCAGGGGKTLALASQMGNKGQIHATDNDKTRLAPIFDRLKRADTRNVQVHAARSDLSALEGKMDCVLIDAPCTGAGTWRRRPDAKWRLTERQLEQRTNEQTAILNVANKFVKRGGRLVYVTCSLFVEENTQRVANFLTDNPGFKCVDHTARLADLCPYVPANSALIATSGATFSPHLTGTDGFFVSVMTRN